MAPKPSAMAPKPSAMAPIALSAHSYRDRLRKLDRERRALGHLHFLAARREDHGCAGAAARRCADRRAFLAADDAADDRAARSGRADLERVLLLRAGGDAADGRRSDLIALF